MLPVSDSINVNISYNVLLLEANMKINLHNDTWKFETRYKDAIITARYCLPQVTIDHPVHKVNFYSPEEDSVLKWTCC